MKVSLPNGNMMDARIELDDGTELLELLDKNGILCSGFRVVGSDPVKNVTLELALQPKSILIDDLASKKLADDLRKVAEQIHPAEPGPVDDPHRVTCIFCKGNGVVCMDCELDPCLCETEDIEHCDPCGGSGTYDIGFEALFITVIRNMVGDDAPGWRLQINRCPPKGDDPSERLRVRVVLFEEDGSLLAIHGGCFILEDNPGKIAGLVALTLDETSRGMGKGLPEVVPSHIYPEMTQGGLVIASPEAEA